MQFCISHRCGCPEISAFHRVLEQMINEYTRCVCLCATLWRLIRRTVCNYAHARNNPRQVISDWERRSSHIAHGLRIGTFLCLLCVLFCRTRCCYVSTLWLDLSNRNIITHIGRRVSSVQTKNIALSVYLCNIWCVCVERLVGFYVVHWTASIVCCSYEGTLYFREWILTKKPSTAPMPNRKKT